MVGGVTFLASLYGFLTYIGADILKPLYPFSFEENQGGRNFIHSFFGNPEYYAGFAAPGAVILWGLSIQSGSIRFKSRLAWLSATVAVFLVMILSGSRSALAGSFTGALIVALGQLRLAPIRLKRIALVSAIGAIAVISSGLFVLSTPNALNPKDMRLLQRFAATFDTQSDSVRERVIFYTSTASAIPRNPIFGSGPGGFRLDFIENVAALSDQLSPGVSTAMLNDISKGLAEHAHNDYLEIWFDQGTLGLGVFFMLIVYGAVSFVRTRHCIKLHGFTPSLAISCHLTIFAALTTMFINALTSFPFQMPARATLAWVLIGSFFALDYALGEACRVASGNSSKITEQERN